MDAEIPLTFCRDDYAITNKHLQFIRTTLFSSKELNKFYKSCICINYVYMRIKTSICKHILYVYLPPTNINKRETIKKKETFIVCFTSYLRLQKKFIIFYVSGKRTLVGKEYFYGIRGTIVNRCKYQH